MYDGLVAGGSDAGLWIPLLAHRQNTMPPQYALVNEVPADAGYSKRTIDLVALLTKEGPTAHESLRRLCDAGVTHVYVGQQQGKAGPNTPQLFAPEAFLEGSAFKLIYQADQVRIFTLDPSVCLTEDK